MSTKNLIPLKELCTHYEVEMSFFSQLDEYGLIEIAKVKESLYISEETVTLVEKIVRMHHELHLNFEGIDVALNLLGQIQELQQELITTQNRLRRYEDPDQSQFE